MSTAPLRVAHLTATYPPYKGGTGVVCHHNALGLAARGHDVTVLTASVPGTPRHEMLAPGVHVRRLPALLRMGNAPLLPGLLGALRGYDVIHLHHPFIFGTEVAVAASLLWRTPLVFTHHNDLVGQGTRALLFDGYSALVSPLVAARAARYIGVSRDHLQHSRLAQHLTARWGTRAVEVPNGVDAEHFNTHVAGQPVRDALGLAAGVPIILFVGGLDDAHHFKGVDVLIDALAALPVPDAVLVIVGDGERRPRYAARAAAHGLADRVRFVGQVDHAHLPPYYAAAAVTVLASFPPESFGLILVESMACGTPVIASDIPGVRTVVDHGENGLRVPPGDPQALADALGTLLADPMRRRAMGDCGRARVEAVYAWPRVVERLEQVYHEAIDAAR